MNGQVGIELTDEDRMFLYEQRNSAHFRVFAKSMEWLKYRQVSLLAQARPDDLLRHQGIIQGLTIAKNLLTLGKIPEDLQIGTDKQ